MSGEDRWYEPIEPEWRPPEAKEVFDRLRADIASALVPPEWARKSPETYARFQARAHAITSILRAEAVRIYLDCCYPRVIGHDSELEGRQVR